MKELEYGNFILAITTDIEAELQTSFTSQTPLNNKPLASPFICYCTV